MSPIPGLNVGHWIATAIGTIVILVLGLALLPTIDTSITDANQTGAPGAMLDIVPLLFVVGIVMVVVVFAVGAVYERFK